MTERGKENSIVRTAVINAAAALVVTLCRLLFDGVWVYALVYPLWVLATLYAFRKARGAGSLVIASAGVCVGFYIFVKGFLPHFVDLVFMPLIMVMLLPYFLDHFFFRRFPDRAAGTLVFPAAWIVSVMINEMCNFGAFGHAEAAHFDNTVFIQAASVIGGRGLCFLIIWIVSVICYIAVRRRAGKGDVTVILSAALCLVLVYGYGFITLNESRKTGKGVVLAWSTGPWIGDFTTEEYTSLEDAKRIVTENAAEAAEKGAVLLAYNEESFSLTPEEAEELTLIAREAAKKNNIALLIGLEHNDTPGVYKSGDKDHNCLVFIGRDGEVLAEYDKTRLVPILETPYFVKGTGAVATAGMDTDTVDPDTGRNIVLKTAFAICYDGDFSDYIAKMDRDADLLIVPSWDWPEVDSTHYADVAIRSVENGVPLLKPTYDGTSIAVDAYGRLISMEKVIGPGEPAGAYTPKISDDAMITMVNGDGQAPAGDFGRVHMVNLPLNGHRTLYPVLRVPLNILYIAGTVFTLGLLVFSFIRDRKKNKYSEN